MEKIKNINVNIKDFDTLKSFTNNKQDFNITKISSDNSVDTINLDLTEEIGDNARDFLNKILLLPFLVILEKFGLLDKTDTKEYENITTDVEKLEALLEILEKCNLGDNVFGIAVEELKDTVKIALIAEKSDMNIELVQTIYDKLKAEGFSLEYGTVSAADGWFTSEYDYNGLYAKYVGDNGLSYVVSLSKIEEANGMVKYSSYSDDELMRCIEGTTSYVNIVQDVINQDLTDFFKQNALSVVNKDKDGNAVICLVDCKTDGRYYWAGLSVTLDTGVRGTAVNINSILNNYYPDNGIILTHDSRVIGTLIHELGHAFDISLTNASGERFAFQRAWQKVYPQIVDYLKELGNGEEGIISLNGSENSKISYSDLIVSEEDWGAIKDLDYEIFTELSRIYYQEPSALQGIEIDYFDKYSGIRYTDLYDFIEAIETGKIAVE